MYGMYVCMHIIYGTLMFVCQWIIIGTSCFLLLFNVVFLYVDIVGIVDGVVVVVVSFDD